MPAQSTKPRARTSDLSVWYVLGGTAASALALVLGLAWGSRPVSALPSFARQTGQPCATCHNGDFPQLTAFGRQFKLNGYTAGGTRCRDSVAPSDAGGTNLQIPISVMLLPTFTHTQKDLASPPTDRSGNTNGNVNNNVYEEGTSVFVGGQIYCQLGAFIQATYAEPDAAFFLDNTDIRYANKTKILGTDLVYGVDVNNNPTVEDPWNTTPAWRMPGDPFSPVAPGMAAPLIDGLGGTVAGAGAYVWVDNMFYAGVWAYRTLDNEINKALGEGGTTTGFDGAAPYWRAAVEKNWDVYSLMFGTFGMTANVIPDITTPSPTDNFTDVGFDTQFQYLDGVHFFTARASYEYEWQTLNGSTSLGAADNLHNHLSELNLSATYSYDARYTVSAAYFNTQGSTDMTLYGGLPSSTGSPNTSGEIVDIGYLPWSHGGPAFWPWLNTRIGVKYTHYDKLNGSSKGYDPGPPPRNAGDDNTTILYAWTAF